MRSGYSVYVTDAHVDHIPFMPFAGQRTAHVVQGQKAVGGDLLQVADPLFHDYGARSAFSGPIATVKCHEDNALVRSTFETPGEG